MPRAPQTVLEAGLSYKPQWENRLTAIFAAVLDQHHQLAQAFFELVDLPVGDRYEAYTEVWVTPSRRVDMQVVAKDAHNADVAQIWSEHKREGGAFSTSQREDYLAALQRQGGGRLLTIVADLRDDETSTDDDLAARPGEASPDDARWWALDWQSVAEMAHNVGRSAPGEWGGLRWRDKALERDAPAANRALYELVWYLEEEGYAVVDPFIAEYVQAVRHMPGAAQTATALLERAADNMTAFTPVGEAVSHDEGFSQAFELPPGGWVDRLEGSAELVVESDDAWVDAPQGEASLAVGVSFDGSWFRPLAALPTWAGQVHAAGFSFAEHDEYVLVYATRPLADVAAHGQTLAEQARFVAGWAGPLLGRILGAEFDPGDVRKPAKPARRKRTAADPGVS